MMQSSRPQKGNSCRSLISIRPFLGGSPFYTQSPKSCSLQWARHSSKSAPFRGSICTPCNTQFSWHTRLSIPNGISIGSAVFAGLTTVTDRLTDGPRYSVCNDRPHLRYVVRRCGLKWKTSLFRCYKIYATRFAALSCGMILR